MNVHALVGLAVANVGNCALPQSLQNVPKSPTEGL